MYQEGQLLKFSPFEFKNGNTPKPKYYVVLKHINEEVMMASLPTSKDHIPSDALVSDGCVDIPERQVNAFVFSPMEPSLFQQLKDCIKKASLLKRKFRKLL